jgi:predicted secreted hydrolase
MQEPAIMASSPRFFQKLGLTHTIQQFEDGLHTDPNESGSYEWWYFDTHLDDGSKLVITFFTKDAASPNGELAPQIAMDLDLPDGRTINKSMTFSPDAFSASKESCDVRIDGNSFKGDLHTYRITATVEELSVDVSLTGQTEAWRPGTGYIFYGRAEEQYFAWLPSVPNGAVTATYSVDGKSTTAHGHGYHDHNWGNVAMPSVVNNWYWGRGSAGPYTFITSHITAEKKYGYAEINPFMIAKDGKVVADDGNKVSFSKSDVHIDEQTHKPVADVHTYTYRNGDSEYEISYHREHTILRNYFIDSIPGFKKLLARLVGFDGCYLRFDGTVTLTRAERGEVVETITEPALWELMYFGKHAHEI